MSCHILFYPDNSEGCPSSDQRRRKEMFHHEYERNWKGEFLENLQFVFYILSSSLWPQMISARAWVRKLKIEIAGKLWQWLFDILCTDWPYFLIEPLPLSEEQCSCEATLLLTITLRHFLPFWWRSYFLHFEYRWSNDDSPSRIVRSQVHSLHSSTTEMKVDSPCYRHGTAPSYHREYLVL